MKKWIVLLLALSLLLGLTACGGAKEAESAKMTLIADFSSGSPESIFKEYPYEGSAEEGITADSIAKGLTELTGLDFTLDSVTTLDEHTLSVDWARTSTLVANLDDREQKEDFFFHDADTLRWFMMDSLLASIQKNLPEYTDIFYTMDGGKELVFDELQPVKAFSLDTPYMGSPFYFAHADGRGDDAEETAAGLPKGVTYAEPHPLESDPGDSLDTKGGAVLLFNAAKERIGYKAGDKVSIELLRLATVGEDEMECYIYKLSTGATSYECAVSILYEEVFFMGEGGPEPVVAKIDPIQEDAALEILREQTLAQYNEMSANGKVVYVSKGEDTIRGQHAWLFDMGKDSAEKFTAEYHFAVTDAGKVLQMDILSGGIYVPFIAG